MTRDVREAVVAPLELEGLPFMVDPEQVLHRGVEVVHVHRVLDDIVAELVGLAVDMTTSDAATRWPWWMGSNVPPITPTRRARSPDPSLMLMGTCCGRVIRQRPFPNIVMVHGVIRP